MFRTSLILATCLALATPAVAQPKPPMSAEAMIAANSYRLTYDEDGLAGPAAAVLRKAFGDAQFVLLGEDHYDQEIPRFATGLYRTLHRDFGFHHLAVEQEQFVAQAANRPGARGDAAALGRLAGRYPTLFEFASDEDLRLLATVGRLETNPEPIWGVEQTTSARRTLEELERLAPNAGVRAQVRALLADAARLEPDPVYRLGFFEDAQSLPKLRALQRAFGPKVSPEASQLLTSIVKSAEIYDYNRRANLGEPVGLYNNTEREAWMKSQFMRSYRSAEARGESAPKAMFKFGDWHMYHGMGPSGAYTLGNLAHELAISHDAHAVGIQLVALRPEFAWKDVAPEIRGVLPASPPTEPTLIDLRPLRPVGRVFRQRVEPDSQWINRALVNGYDFVLVLPNSQRAHTALSGLKLP